MPSYTYRCRECGHRRELLQSCQEMRESRTRQRCPRCEGAMQFVFPAPALNTDTTFMAGRGDGFGLDDNARRRAYAKAKREGTDIGGKVWMPSLNAWVGSKSEVKALALARGCGVRGSVNAPAPEPLEPPPKKRYEVAEHIVQQEVSSIVEDNRGDVTPKEQKELVEATRTRLRGTQDD